MFQQRPTPIQDYLFICKVSGPLLVERVPARQSGQQLRLSLIRWQDIL